MKKEVKILRAKAVDSLVLAVEHFNRPSDRGRQEAVLILLDRAFELLLKAIIVHRGGRIRDRGAKQTIGFDRCVRKCLTEESVKCLSDEEALTLQMINGLRDAAQHYILDISEQHLYMQAQAGLTLFDSLQGRVFNVRVKDELPSRVLPITTSPPKDLASMIEAELSDIRELAKPGSRKRFLARAKVRPLAIIEASVSGMRSQPGPHELDRLVTKIADGAPWTDLFPGVATLRLDTEGTGLSVSIRLSKSEGEPVRLVAEGTPGATVVAVHKVNQLDYYSLGLAKLAPKVGLSQPKALALIRYLNLQEDSECFKSFRIGSSEHKRYSMKAVNRMKEALKDVDMEEVWKKHQPRQRTRRRTDRSAVRTTHSI